MTDARLQWLQKPESTKDACSEYERDGDFERGLEEFCQLSGLSFALLFQLIIFKGG
ncbi:hypothetical protein Hdeb2414_s0006g00198971 [Helianthus debilis subsp. tardiflorus]